MNPSEEQSNGQADGSGDRLVWNVPNALCAIRVVVSIASLLAAFAGRPWLFLGMFLIAAFTDWIDGTLAAWLNQRTAFGARFDSVADAAMYGALLVGSIWLKGEVLAGETIWIAAALGCFLASCVLGVIKFGRLPSYHAYSAKLAWFVTVVSAVLLLVGWAVWPLRVAATAVALANLEALAITLILSRWQTDVPTLWHALRRC